MKFAELTAVNDFTLHPKLACIMLCLY